VYTEYVHNLSLILYESSKQVIKIITFPLVVSRRPMHMMYT